MDRTGKSDGNDREFIEYDEQEYDDKEMKEVDLLRFPNQLGVRKHSQNVPLEFIKVF